MPTNKLKTLQQIAEWEPNLKHVRSRTCRAHTFVFPCWGKSTAAPGQMSSTLMPMTWGLCFRKYSSFVLLSAIAKSSKILRCLHSNSALDFWKTSAFRTACGSWCVVCVVCVTVLYGTFKCPQTEQWSVCVVFFCPSPLWVTNFASSHFTLLSIHFRPIIRVLLRLPTTWPMFHRVNWNR